MEITKRSRKSLKFDVDVGEAMNNCRNLCKQREKEVKRLGLWTDICSEPYSFWENDYGNVF